MTALGNGVISWKAGSPIPDDVLRRRGTLVTGTQGKGLVTVDTDIRLNGYKPRIHDKTKNWMSQEGNIPGTGAASKALPSFPPHRG